MKEKKYFKYNEDDILGILAEDLRMVVEELKDDSIKEEDLNQLDKDIQYNGSHTKISYLNPERFLKLKF